MLNKGKGERAERKSVILKKRDNLRGKMEEGDGKNINQKGDVKLKKRNTVNNLTRDRKT